MLVRARSRDVLLPIMLYPMTVPVMIAGVRGTAALLQPTPDLAMAQFWLGLLGSVRRGVPDARAVDLRPGHDGLNDDSDRRYAHARDCAAGMFAVAPWIINAAPYEATMGLVLQDLFTSTCRRRWMFLVAAIVCGVAQHPVPVLQDGPARMAGRWPRQSSRCCSAPSRWSPGHCGRAKRGACGGCGIRGSPRVCWCG